MLKSMSVQTHTGTQKRAPVMKLELLMPSRERASMQPAETERPA